MKQEAHPATVGIPRFSRGEDVKIRCPPGDWGGFPQPRVVQREATGQWPPPATQPTGENRIGTFGSSAPARDQRPAAASRREWEITGCAAESGPLLSAAWLGLRRRVSVTAPRRGTRSGGEALVDAEHQCPRVHGPLVDFVAEPRLGGGTATTPSWGAHRGGRPGPHQPFPAGGISARQGAGGLGGGWPGRADDRGPAQPRFLVGAAPHLPSASTARSWARRAWATDSSSSCWMRTIRRFSELCCFHADRLVQPFQGVHRAAVQRHRGAQAAVQPGVRGPKTG